MDNVLHPAAIIGRMTSVQTLSAHPITEAAGMVSFSQVERTPELSRRDDHFFRVSATHLLPAEVFARHL